MNDALCFGSIYNFPRFADSNRRGQTFAVKRFQTPPTPDPLQEDRLENKRLSEAGLRHAGEISTISRHVVLFLMRKFLKYWLPVLLWMIFITGGSTDLMSVEHTSRFIGPFLRWLIPDISESTIYIIQLFVRKCAHLTEYAVLAALLFRAFRQGRQELARAAVSAFIIALIFASLDEFHQSFVPSREASPYDVALDAVGALVGLAIYRFIVRKARLEPAISQT